MKASKAVEERAKRALLDCEHILHPEGMCVHCCELALGAHANEALEAARIAVVKALRDYNPGGRWNWEGYEDEAVECVETAFRALKE